MTTVAQKLTTIDNSLKAIKQAIITKGVTPTGDITTYATAIGNISGGGTPSGKYTLLDRVEDDNGNEIGTVSGFFTDANDIEYAVICLDQIYRPTSSAKWCSDSSSNSITNLPVLDRLSSSWFTSKDTATFNTQCILDYCTSNNYTSEACSHCRSKSFIIDGTTYYGQLPNMLELLDIYKNYISIDNADTSSTATSRKLYNFSMIWSSNQSYQNYAWCLYNYGTVNSINRTGGCRITPVLEIPLNS